MPPTHRLSDEQKHRLAEYKSAFTFTDRDRDIEADHYSEGRYVQRPMRRSNRAVKHSKQWRTSQQERAVLRYTTGG